MSNEISPFSVFKGYLIFADSLIFSLISNRLIKGRLGNHGYRYITIDGKNILIHRLMCRVFLGNKRKMHVNHKDGNKLNNNIENLEWCTRSQNQLHAYKTGLMKPKRLWKEDDVMKSLTLKTLQPLRISGISNNYSTISRLYNANRTSLHIGKILIEEIINERSKYGNDFIKR